MGLEKDQQQWSFSVLRVHDLEYLHKNKAWRPIVSVSFNSPGVESEAVHCLHYETILGTDGQNPNQKEKFLLSDIPTPRSMINIEIFYRSASKRKAKKRVLVASSSCYLGELVLLQKEETKPHLRLAQMSKPSKISKDKASKFSTIQFRLVSPPGIEKVREWRSTLRSLSLNTESCNLSDSRTLDDEDVVDSPTSVASSSWWPSNPQTPTHEEKLPHPSEPHISTQTPHPPETETNVLRRRHRRRKPVPQGYSVESDAEAAEVRWISESCSEAGEEEDDGFGSSSPTPTLRVEDSSSDDTKSSSREADSKNSPSPQADGWYTEVIRFIGIIDIIPMMDPGILPTYWTREGSMDSKENHSVDTASVHSCNSGPEVEIDLEDTRSLLVADSENTIYTPAAKKDCDDKVERLWWEKALCAFTMYWEMKNARELYGKSLQNPNGEIERGIEQADNVERGRKELEKIIQLLQMEWTCIGGLLVGLAAVDTAIFAISSDALFHLNEISVDFVAASSVFTGVGMVCDAWLFLRYSWCDLDTFLDRSLDIYSTHTFFSLSARVPALCLFLSALALLGVLALTAYSAWPTGVIVVCFLVGLVMGLQFVVKGVEVVGKGIGGALRFGWKGVKKGIQWICRRGESMVSRGNEIQQDGEGRTKDIIPVAGPDVRPARHGRAKAKMNVQNLAGKKKIRAKK